nr:myosin light chain kinase, smooth muscle-like [Pongo abelii]
MGTVGGDGFPLKRRLRNILALLSEGLGMNSGSAHTGPMISGNPPPEVIWLHNGNEIQGSEDFHFEQRGTQHSLCIQEVFLEDTGTYICEAWNSAGEVHTQAMLMVQEPHDGTQPWFISKPRSVTASLGQSVLISCAIAGDPFPTVHWLRDGKALCKDTGHFEVLQNEDVFTLVLKKVQPWHAGQYEILLNPASSFLSEATALALALSPPEKKQVSGEFPEGTWQACQRPRSSSDLDLEQGAFRGE